MFLLDNSFVKFTSYHYRHRCQHNEAKELVAIFIKSSTRKTKILSSTPTLADTLVVPIYPRLASQSHIRARARALTIRSPLLRFAPTKCRKCAVQSNNVHTRSMGKVSFLVQNKYYQTYNKMSLRVLPLMPPSSSSSLARSVSHSFHFLFKSMESIRRHPIHTAVSERRRPNQDSNHSLTPWPSSC